MPRKVTITIDPPFNDPESNMILAGEVQRAHELATMSYGTMDIVINGKSYVKSKL